LIFYQINRYASAHKVGVVVTAKVSASKQAAILAKLYLDTPVILPVVVY